MQSTGGSRANWIVAGAGLALVALCVLCVGGVLISSQRGFTRAAMTRTALVQFIGTPMTVTSNPDSHIATVTQAVVTQTLRPTLPEAISSPVPERATPTFSPPIFLEPPPGQIAYTCFVEQIDQICVMQADGTRNHQITELPATSFYPSLAPDGNTVLFSSRQDGNFEIYELQIESGILLKLTDNLGNAYAPEISPNGNRIVFTVESGGQQTIWIMKRDGSNARPISLDDADGIDPTWAPNNSQIAFASARSGDTELYLINADGSGLRRITRGVARIGGRSDWSPDGEKLVFYAGPDGDRDIYVIGVDGRGLQQLTDGGDNLGPSYSPDSRWITFTSYRDGNNEIYIMRSDGSEQTRLTGTPRPDWQPRWGVLP